MDDHRPAYDFLRHEPVGIEHRKGITVIFKERRQIPGVFRVRTILRI